MGSYLSGDASDVAMPTPIYTVKNIVFNQEDVLKDKALEMCNNRVNRAKE